jgi:hypothetical protein
MATKHLGLIIAHSLPLFEFARINRIPMIALNVDAKLTRAIGDKGWDALPEHEREGVGRAAPASEAYRDFLFTVYGSMRTARDARSSRAFQYFVEAQQNWDRAMAEALAARRVSGPQGQPPLVVGIIGSGHLRLVSACRTSCAISASIASSRSCRSRPTRIAARFARPCRCGLHLSEKTRDTGGAAAPRRH